MAMNGRAFLELLAADSCISEDRIDAILEAMDATGDRADTAVLDIEHLPEEIVLTRLGRFLRSKTVSGAALTKTTPEVTNLVSPRVARRFGVVPFAKEGRTLHVAALEPEDLFAQDELALLTGCMVKTYAALELRIWQALSLHYGGELTPRFERLLQRLIRGPKHPPDETGPAAVKTSHQVETPPEPRDEAAQTPKPTPKARRTRPSARPSELEISSEDLELFPSLAAFYEASSETVDLTAEAAVENSPAATASNDSQPPDPVPTRDRLAQAAETLQSAEMRDDIADALLEFTSELYRRRMLLIVRGDNIVGWRGEGPGVEPAAVRAISIPKTEPSVFLALLQGTAFWLGPLPPMPRNREILLALGEPEPSGCLVLPIKVRGKIVAFLYADAGADAVPSPPMTELKRLLAKADLAFQVFLLKGKIRTV